MKKFKLLFVLLISLLFANAQTVFLTSQNYENLKAAGKLNSKTIYKFIDEPNNKVQQAKQNNAINSSSNFLPAKVNSIGSCQCLVPVDPTFSVVPMAGYTPPSYRNDDGSSSLIQLGFNFCFYGSTYSSCFINNNGNITFNSALFSFSAGGFPAGNASTLDTIMVAPFWGDVDTRAPASGLVYYKKTPTAFIVKWNNVGYYNSMADKINDFQLIITDGTDPILPNGNNIAFCYGDMQWTTGSASMGTGGFGGIPATVGVNKGDNLNFVQIGRFDQAGLGYDGPYGANDGISFLDNKSYFFNTCGTNNNLPPIIQDASGGGSACGDTIRICALGDTLVYTTTFLAPENTQSITINGSAPTLGGSFQPLGVTTSSAGTTTYAWMVVASPSVTGVHTVIITGTDNGTPPLSSSATYFIKIENLAVPQPTILSSPIGTVCATPGATLTVASCASYDNVYWSNGASGCSTVATATGLYFVTVKKSGCFKSSADSIFVFPNPLPVVVGPLNYCPPATSTTLSLAPPVVGMAAYTNYTWTPGPVNTATASLNGTLAGKSYTVKVTDANGCIGSTTFIISTSTPTVGITANPISICGAGTSTLTASISGATSYSWSNGASTQSTMVNTSGVYTVTVDANSCIATKTINVNINPTPTLVIPTNVGMCSGSNATVAAVSISPTGAYTYTWSTGLNASSITISTATVLTLQVTNNATGCVSAISNSCSVVTAANPTITMASPVIFCVGSNATLSPTVNSGTPNYSYAWTPSVLGAAATATTANQGIYSVLVTDANFCVGSTTVAAIMSSPAVTLSSPDLLICPNECSEITAVGSSSFTPFAYTWSNDVANTTDSTIMCSAGDVVISFTDAQGCIATNTITIINDVVPVANFTSTPPSPVTPTILINFTSTSTILTGSITSSIWTFGDGNSASGNPVDYAYTAAGIFPVVLTVTGSNGCVNSYTANYVVDAIIEVPNVITPNGDNANEFLKFKNLELLGTNNLSIFNRWGKKLIEIDNYKNDWNGGSYVDGTYFFILSVPKATPNTYKGYFQIIH
jgi:gliding motility-associated-like protein